MTRPAPARRRLPQVDPSARDPIASWLDVFIALLALPPRQRQTIRDELEDHLRSRVDDLLITGLTEPDAVRAAVGELGETADLARAFRAAARPRHPRRIAMTATAFTALGAALTVGIATMVGLQPAAPGHAAPAAASRPQTIALRGATFGSLFDLMRQHTAEPVLIHWDRLEEVGITADTPVDLDVDPLPIRLVHTLLMERAESLAGQPLAFHHSEGLVEVSTREHFDRRTAELRHYEVADLVFNAGSPRALFGHGDQIAETVRDLCEADAWHENGGDLARARFAGGTLFIDAPARIHEEVASVLRTLHERARAASDARGDEEEDAIAQRHAHIAALREALEQAAGDYARLRARCERLMAEHADIAAEDPDVAERIMTELTLLEVQRDLADARVGQISSRIVTQEGLSPVPPAAVSGSPAHPSDADHFARTGRPDLQAAAEAAAADAPAAR